MCGDKNFVIIFNSKILAKLNFHDELEKLYSKLICALATQKTLYLVYLFQWFYFTVCFQFSFSIM